MTDLFAVTEATWPAAALHRAGAFLLREGKGGGQRVSAATALGSWTETDIDTVEGMAHGLGQAPLFMLRPGDEALDRALGSRGYRIKDPVHIYEGPIKPLTEPAPPPVSAFALWPPLAIMHDLWAEDGIGPERIAVMTRAAGTKAAILGRINDRASGAAYVGIHKGTAMLHALYITADQRRQGSAVYMMRKAAIWAQDQGATRFSVIVTQANTPANALYASLGLQVVGHYHYRSK
ncbi:MAG: GNAT family N-acetyltransferase [Albidovulum sp.]